MVSWCVCSNLRTLLIATCSGQQYLPVVEGAIMRVLLAHSPEYTMKILCKVAGAYSLLLLQSVQCNVVK